MALSKVELNQIHLRKLATPNKKYYGDDDKVYVGTEDKRLRLFGDADKENFKPTTNISDKTVQLAIERVDNKLSQKFKQVEIDFEEELYKDYKIFTIPDSDIQTGDIIIANIAYDAPTFKDLDEIEMDPIICTAGTSVEGSFQLIFRGLQGSLRNKFKVNYTIQWQ